MYQLTVSWNATGGAAFYEVYHNTTNMPPAAVPTLSAVSETRAVLTGLANGLRVGAGGEHGGVKRLQPHNRNRHTPHTDNSLTAPGSSVLTARSWSLSVYWEPMEMANAYDVWAGTSSNSVSATKHGADISGGST